MHTAAYPPVQTLFRGGHSNTSGQATRHCCPPLTKRFVLRSPQYVLGLLCRLLPCRAATSRPAGRWPRRITNTVGS